ncbi:MAG TPA: pyrroloquinoline quinone biosynthesis peptide chaperone PqqD [Pseudonocardiaceae bacterium]|nr:pyrroloquinoline quinone biosynthesis peptide chaperone PqqD [Pseudonocardiaceae bacterium]
MTAADRPTLRRGVRTGTDPLGGGPVLLFPEGVLFLNHTAAAVIERCDGSHTVADLVQALGEMYDGVTAGDVQSLLRELIAQRLLVARRE